MRSSMRRCARMCDSASSRRPRASERPSCSWTCSGIRPSRRRASCVFVPPRFGPSPSKGDAPCEPRKERRMPEVQEVFQMATQKVRPDPGALERQHHDQRQHAVRRKASVFALIGALLLIAGGVAVSVARNDPAEIDVGNPGRPTASPAPPAGGSLEPGRYALGVAPEVGDLYQVSVDVPEAYRGVGFGVLRNGRSEQSVSAWVVEKVFNDACDQFEGSVDPSSPQGVAAALGAQKGFRSSTPTDVTL